MATSTRGQILVAYALSQILIIPRASRKSGLSNLDHDLSINERDTDHGLRTSTGISRSQKYLCQTTSTSGSAKHSQQHQVCPHEKTLHQFQVVRPTN